MIIIMANTITVSIINNYIIDDPVKMVVLVKMVSQSLAEMFPASCHQYLHMQQSNPYALAQELIPRSQHCAKS